MSGTEWLVALGFFAVLAIVGRVGCYLFEKVEGWMAD